MPLVANLLLAIAWLFASRASLGYLIDVFTADAYRLNLYLALAALALVVVRSSTRGASLFSPMTRAPSLRWTPLGLVIGSLALQIFLVAVGDVRLLATVVGPAIVEEADVERHRSAHTSRQQRVALARALVIEPRLLLLDEPLANLDRRLREQMRGEVKEIQRRVGVTSILVTHDQEEALALADRIALMIDGRILQIGAPAEVYSRLRMPCVARFLGEANLWTIDGINATVRLAGLSIGVAAFDRESPPAGGIALLRPEHVRLAGEAESCHDRWNGRVLRSTFLGADRLLDVEVEGGACIRARVRPNGRSLAVGDAITVGVPEGAMFVVPEPDPT